MEKPEKIDSNKIDNIIMQHCCIAGAAGLVPIPFADLAIMLPQQIVLYKRLNKEYGVSLSENSMKVIGSFMISQITGMVSVFGIAIFAKAMFSTLKAIPGIGTIAGAAVDATTNAAITWVLGVVYFIALENVAKNSGNVTEERLKESLATQFANKGKIRDLFQEGKLKVKGIDFSKFKTAAKSKTD